MTLLKEEKSKQINVKTLLLLIGIVGIGFNLYYKYDRYYLGEILIAKQITIYDSPEYIETGKGGTDRYSFSAVEYKCRFWISHGGLSIVRNDENIKLKIKSIKKGDVLNLKIRQTDESNLQNESARPRVIELSIGQDQVIKAKEVEKRDKKWYKISFGLPIMAMIIWIIIILSEFLLKSRSRVKG